MRTRKNPPVFDPKSVNPMARNADIVLSEDQIQQFSEELEEHYRDSTHYVIDFDKLKECCYNADIEKYRNSYGSMFDLNGAIVSYTIGFHFSLAGPDVAEEDIYPKERPEYVKEMIETFQPIQIWAGNREIQAQLEEMGYSSTYFPYFEGGGFMVVLKTPVFR